MTLDLWPFERLAHRVDEAFLLSLTAVHYLHVINSLPPCHTPESVCAPEPAKFPLFHSANDNREEVPRGDYMPVLPVSCWFITHCDSWQQRSVKLLLNHTASPLYVHFHPPFPFTHPFRCHCSCMRRCLDMLDDGWLSDFSSSFLPENIANWLTLDWYLRLHRYDFLEGPLCFLQLSVLGEGVAVLQAFWEFLYNAEVGRTRAPDLFLE